MKPPLFPLDPIKIQLYFPDGGYVEPGIEGCDKLDPSTIDDVDVRWLFEEVGGQPIKQVYRYLLDHSKHLQPTTLLMRLRSNGGDPIPRRLDGSLYHAIIVQRPLNTIYELDRFFAQANYCLQDGGYLVTNCRTSAVKKAVIMKRFPKGINRVAYALHYLWHRVCPKLWGLKNLYFAVTKGRNRTFHRVEILGRLYHAGFEVLYESTESGELRVLARKVNPPITGRVPSSGPIAKLRRVGKNGKTITVYKFRTMYVYSEYLQEYVYRHLQLDDTGKFYHDYRVNPLGRLLRRTWLDELPMVVNMLKGEMKLVGVRPLSMQYFGLYTPEMQRLRVKTKPGLLPPLYYEKVQPETLEEIQESERRYIEAYLRHPIATDWRYFWGIVSNIVFKHKHSH